MKLARFLIFYHVFAALVACAAIAVQLLAGAKMVLAPYFWLLFVAVYVLTLVAYVLSDLGIRKGGEISIYSLMGGLFVKLFASLMVVAVLILKFPEYKLITAFNFFSLYFLFTIFEVICLLRNLRDQNEK
ncbi:hypothetical protein ACFOET_16325 [Parapedobacter deserti]|uniref:ATP synthase protein I n=1 Tax=Parapedobacter deserti TaxID=1912957 RepID=A0ABV7JSD1_9SPHI